MRSEPFYKSKCEGIKASLPGWREEREERVFKLKILRCCKETWKLAVPVVVARLGTVGMALVDTVVVGRYSTQDLAFQSIATTLHTLLLSIAMGLLQGTIVLTANAFGRGKYRDCGQVLRRSIPYGLLIGILFAAACLPSQFIMNLLGQPPEVAEGSAKVLSVYALGMPFALMFFVMSSFLEGTKRPVPGMVMILLANVINIFANYAFVYGHYGFPAMGAVGSAISTTLIRVVLAVGMFIIVFCIDENDLYGVWVRPDKNKEEDRRIRDVGYGAAVTVGVEEGSYSMVNIMAGWLGAMALGAYTIMLNVSTNVFVLASGVGSAASVLMGIAKGKKSVLDMQIVGYTGVIFNLIIMLLCSAFCLMCPHFITSIYTKDPELTAMTTPLVMICSLMCIFDGTQQVMVNILRGAVDILVPTICQGIAFVFIMLPLIWLFSFKWNYGVMGMTYAMIIACACAAVFLVVRFVLICRQYKENGFGR
ncbi:MAG: MATE family efflux transporter [Alphaproteobacteria bacterium]|nr:MATE family efflux transporter [Alphaproteobacteria bacterium]